MIVLATYNGKKFLEGLLDDIKSFKIFNEDVCIVDNNSTNKDHLEYLIKLKNENYNILYNKRGGYDIGAFKYALDNLKSDVWFCMQDSIRLKQDIFSYVTPLLTNKNVYTILTVPPGLYDNVDDRMFLSLHYKTTQYSSGMFPSSYFALDEVMQKVKNDWYIPTNKIESMGMERGMCVVFDKYGIEIKGLGVYNSTRTGDSTKNGYPFFYKIYGGRQ